MKTYESNGWFKMVEKEEYEYGCTGTAQGFAGNERFSSDTLEGLIDKINAFVGNDDHQNILLDSGGEIGRVDIQVRETDDGYPAGKQDFTAWRAGEQELWLACYTFHCEKVERKEATGLSLLKIGQAAH